MDTDGNDDGDFDLQRADGDPQGEPEIDWTDDDFAETWQIEKPGTYFLYVGAWSVGPFNFSISLAASSEAKKMSMNSDRFSFGTPNLSVSAFSKMCGPANSRRGSGYRHQRIGVLEEQLDVNH